jgi:integrase
MLLGMASVWKHPQSQYFTACFRDHNGRQRRITTKETNRKKAQMLADEYEKASRTKRTLKQAQAVLDRLHEELSGKRIVRATFRTYLESWFEAKEAATAPATMAFYRKSLGKFVEFLGLRADEPMTEITQQDIVAFRNKLAAQVAAKTANHDLKALKMLFKSARRDGIVVDNSAEFVDTIRQRAITPKRGFNTEEVRAILDVADDEWRSMVLFGLYTGQRLSDIASLRWSNVNLLLGELRLVTRKTGKTMILPIAARLRRLLESVPATDDPNAPIHPRACATVERQGKTGNLSNQFADLLARAGLRQKKDHKGHGKGRGVHREIEKLSFHSLRRTATTLLHQAGVPAAVAQAMIGHDSEAIHQQYVSVGREALEQAAASLPDLG